MEKQGKSGSWIKLVGKMNRKRHVDVDIAIESFHLSVNSMDAGGPNLDRMRSER